MEGDNDEKRKLEALIKDLERRIEEGNKLLRIVTNPQRRYSFLL
jgi:benzoyl-CoA reductase/2-hydroxyglutaryl-CoA dehydratase subunit BcrC/BadD/HgdB